MEMSRTGVRTFFNVRPPQTSSRYQKIVASAHSSTRVRGGMTAAENTMFVSKA